MFRNGILNLKKEYIEEKHVHNARTLEHLWEVLPQEEKSKKGQCELCPSRHLTNEYDKTKYKQKLDPEADLRLQLSRILRELQLMCSATQPQSSHW